jgi:hypothetical protein
MTCGEVGRNHLILASYKKAYVPQGYEANYLWRNSELNIQNSFKN